MVAVVGFAAARGNHPSTRRNVYETGWTHTSVEGPHGEERWFAVNLLEQNGEKIWARSEAEAKAVASEKEADRLLRAPRQCVDVKVGMVKRQYLHQTK